MSSWGRRIDASYRHDCVRHLQAVQETLQGVADENHPHVRCAMTRIEHLLRHHQTLRPAVWTQKVREVTCNLANHMLTTEAARDDVVDAWGVLKHRMSYLSWLRTRCSRRVLRIVHLGP